MKAGVRNLCERAEVPDAAINEGFRGEPVTPDMTNDMIVMDCHDVMTAEDRSGCPYPWDALTRHDPERGGELAGWRRTAFAIRAPTQMMGYGNGI